MKKDVAERYAKMQAVMSGGVSVINGKKLTSRNGYWYLDDEIVEDLDKEVLDFVEVDDVYVHYLMAQE